GKPEATENDLEALTRELAEELGCGLDLKSVSYLGSFADQAADKPAFRVVVRLYLGRLLGDPVPQSEIEFLKWFSPFQDSADILAPSLQNHIVPFLLKGGQMSRQTVSAA